jgi:hypothetical protein
MVLEAVVQNTIHMDHKDQIHILLEVMVVEVEEKVKTILADPMEQWL